MEKNLPKIGLALGSGGPRGLAHIGVIKALKKSNIPIDFITGSSIGALIGGLYAATKNINKIEKLVLGANWKKLFYLLGEPSFTFSGLLKGERIENFIAEQFKVKNFNDLKIPFAAIATDMKTGKEIAFKRGNLSKAIRASISLPLIFTPLKWQGRVLVDGGISAPVPVTVTRKMGADIVIGVNVLQNYAPKNKDSNKRQLLDIFSVVEDSLRILQANLACNFLKEADIVIEPIVRDVSWINLLEFIKAKKLIGQGFQATILIVPEIKKLLQAKDQNQL